MDAAQRAARDAARGALLPVGHRGLLSIGIMGAMVMQILDTTIANVALPHIESTLGATMDSISWVLTSYIVATAIALPTTGWLSDKFGSRNLFLSAVGGFMVASMLCGLAQNIGELVLFRCLQGIAAAFIGPLSQTSMLDINPPERHAKAMGLWGMGMMAGPIAGPLIGGWLTQNYSWRWVFYINVPIGAATFAILWFLLPSRRKLTRQFDFAGFAMVAVAVASFQLMLDRGTEKDWFSSWEIIIEAMLAIGAAWMAVVHLSTAATPLFPRALFKDRNLVTASIFMVIVGISTMSPMALLPQMLQQLLGYGVLDAGMLLVPRTFGVLFAVMFLNLTLSRIDTRVFITVGQLAGALALWQMSQWSLEVGAWPIVTTGLIQGIGMGLVFMPLNTVAFATLDMHYRTDGSSLMSLTRNMGQSVGISMATVLLGRNIQTSHSDLAQHITEQSIPPLDLGALSRFGSYTEAGFAYADAMINRQAAMIAYLDDFHLLAVMSILIVPLVVFLRKPKGVVKPVISE